MYMQDCGCDAHDAKDVATSFLGISVDVHTYVIK